jgi:hypothetical protein
LSPKNNLFSAATPSFNTKNCTYLKSHSKRKKVLFEAAPSFNTKKTAPISNATIKENKFSLKLHLLSIQKNCTYLKRHSKRK